MGTASTTDDILGSYSAGIAHSAGRGPDFVAVGSHMQGLRVPNSYIGANHPEGWLSARYFRGSGTSQAAAITSGTIALILQKYPALTPDQVQRFIASNTCQPSGADPDYWGSGEINLASLLTKTPAAYTQSFANATGTGSLELSRGTDHPTAANGVVLSGEQDIFGRTFNSPAMATATAAGSTSSGGTWSGSTWSGSTWSGCTWSGGSWSGNSWATGSWN